MKEIISQFLPHIQIILSVLLISSVVLQQTGAMLGGAFGSDNFSSVFHKRRGFEKFLFKLTIVLAVLFTLSSIAQLALHAS